jgi:hypothetical protein
MPNNDPGNDPNGNGGGGDDPDPNGGNGYDPNSEENRAIVYPNGNG